MLLTIILIVLLIVSIVCNYFLTKTLIKIGDALEVYETWIYETRNHIIEVYNQLKIVDARNIFEKDDDVGFVFTEIIELIKNLNEKINEEPEIKTENDN